MDTIYTIHKYLSIFNIYHIRQNISNRSSHQRCSLKKGFLEISQNLQENICARVSFLIKLEASGVKSEKETLAQSCRIFSPPGKTCIKTCYTSLERLRSQGLENQQSQFCKVGQNILQTRI